MMKGIAILGIVFYHLLAPSLFKSFLIQITDSLLISFFFFSGYFHKPGKRTIKENLKRRTKSLMVPFFKYSLLFWAIGTIQLVATKKETLKDAFCCLRNFYAGCIWNRVIQNWFGWEYHSLGKRYAFLADFWFLIALLFASILFFLVVDFLLSSKIRSITGIVLLFALTGVLCALKVDLPYNIQIVPFWTAFMVLGAFAGKYNLFEPQKLSSGAKWGVSIVCLSAGIATSLLKPAIPNLFRGSFGDNPISAMVLSILASILLIWGLCELFILIEQAGVRTKELSWLGSNSLVFYIYHMFFAWIFCTITGFSTQYQEPSSTKVLMQSLLLVAACLACCILRIIIGEMISKKKLNKENGR